MWQSNKFMKNVTFKYFGYYLIWQNYFTLSMKYKRIIQVLEGWTVVSTIQIKYIHTYPNDFRQVINKC